VVATHSLTAKQQSNTNPRGIDVRAHLEDFLQEGGRNHV